MPGIRRKGDKPPVNPYADKTKRWAVKPIGKTGMFGLFDIDISQPLRCGTESEMNTIADLANDIADGLDELEEDDARDI